MRLSQERLKTSFDVKRLMRNIDKKRSEQLPSERHFEW